MSQNPYAERFIGKPYVITVDIKDMNEMRSAIEEALRSPVKIFNISLFQS